MTSSFPAVDALFASKTRIHFNLGIIGRLQGHQPGPHGPSVLPLKPFYRALVQTNPGLAGPGRDLDAKLLRVPEGMPLALLAATRHGFAYYAILDLQESAVQAALQFPAAGGAWKLASSPKRAVRSGRPCTWSDRRYRH